MLASSATCKQYISTFYYSNEKQARVYVGFYFAIYGAALFRLLSQIEAAAVQMGDKECLYKQLGLSQQILHRANLQ